LFLAAVFIADKVDAPLKQAIVSVRPNALLTDQFPSQFDYATSPADLETAEPVHSWQNDKNQAFVLGLLPVCS
jgi:hypothetical protein